MVSGKITTFVKIPTAIGLIIKFNFVRRACPGYITNCHSILQLAPGLKRFVGWQFPARLAAAAQFKKND